MKGRELAILAVIAACGRASPTMTDAQRQDVAASVDSATRAFQAAERSLDPERAIAHLAPQFYMYVDGARTGYDSVTASIRRNFPTFREFATRFDDLDVVVLAPDAAVASFTFHDSIVTASGDTLRLRGPTTLVWQRRGPEWLIVYADADHYPP